MVYFGPKNTVPRNISEKCLRPKTPFEQNTVIVRTSQTHPISVSWILEHESGGRVGISYCPGKQVSRGGIHWHRDLNCDLDRLKDVFGVTTILCLLNEAELSSFKLRNYSAVVRDSGLSLIQFPIIEMAPPDSMERTINILKDLIYRIRRGEIIVLHCRGGVGRAGLIAACMLLHLQLSKSAKKAIERIRTLRCKSAVESYSQEQFVYRYAETIFNTNYSFNGNDHTWKKEYIVYEKKTKWENKKFSGKQEEQLVDGLYS